MFYKHNYFHCKASMFCVDVSSCWHNQGTSQSLSFQIQYNVDAITVCEDKKKTILIIQVFVSSRNFFTMFSLELFIFIILQFHLENNNLLPVNGFISSLNSTLKTLLGWK